MEHSPPSNTQRRLVALQAIEELEGLTRAELEWMGSSGTERSVQDGELIFSQAAPPHGLILVLAGEVTIKRRTSSPVTVFAARTGQITGRMPFTRDSDWNADGRASGNVWLLEIDESQFPAMLSAIPSMTERIVRILIDRNREYTRAEEQIGKLGALSKLAANLAHELNNPASAARSAALALNQDAKCDAEEKRYQLGLNLSEQGALNRYIAGLTAIRSRIRLGSRISNSSLASQMEDMLNDWLLDKSFGDAWKLAPILAEAEVSVSQLEEFLAPVPSEHHPLALHDLLTAASRDANITSVIQATERIFRIVGAVKDYSYMDRQPLQDVNLATAIETVLLMFGPRLKNVTVKKCIPPGLPVLHGYGSELNQAFSALIENSLDAMEDEGILTISIKVQGDTLLIDIDDDGCGIPLECRDRVFEPFFTTKPLGGGLGLGLDTVQRVVAKHFGAVAFDTSAQGTTFHVRLPIDRVGVY